MVRPVSIQLFDETELWDERYGFIYEVKLGRMDAFGLVVRGHLESYR